MSGGAEIIDAVAEGVGSLITFGAYAAFKAGELVVMGAAGLVKLSASGIKAVAGALAEQQKKLVEEAERKRVEREKKREDERLVALGNQKKIAEERIYAIINDSNESADMISRIAADAQSEVDEVVGMYATVAGDSGFDCTAALSRLSDIQNRISAVQSRLASDNTAAELDKTIESIRSAGQSEQVREYLRSLRDNSELVAELQVSLASARMECAALKKTVLALIDLHRELSELSVEMTASDIIGLEKINMLVRNTDASDYESVMQTYGAVNELISQLKRTADASKNVRLSAFLSSRLAVIQDRLNSIVGEQVVQDEEDDGAEFLELLAKVEDYYAVLSDGRLNYMSGIISEKVRAARINARAKNDLESLRRTVKFLESETAVYESLCEEYDKYIALKSECDELAVALGLSEESDNFSADAAVLEKEIARLDEMKKKYMAELAENRRSTLIARASLAFMDSEYEFLGEYAFGDEEGTVQLLYARKGEIGAIHVIQADLTGYVSTFTTGVTITKDGTSLTTVGSEHIKKACAKMRENHLRNTREFDEMIGVDYVMTSILDLPPESPEALELPCVALDGQRLEEYLAAVGAKLRMENGELKLVDINHAGEGGSNREVITGGAARNKVTDSRTSAGGVLHADINKK